MAAAAVIANALIQIDPRYPTVSAEARAALQEARVGLEAEAPGRSEPDPLEAGQAAKAARNPDKAPKGGRKKSRGKDKPRG